MTAGFFIAATLLHGFFELGTLSLQTLPVFLVLAAACYPLQKLLEAGEIRL